VRGADLNAIVYAEFPTSGGIPYDLAVSADGTQVVFGLDEQVHVMDLVPGAVPRRLTYGTRPAYSPVFSPEASEIAFVRSNGSCGPFCDLRDVHLIPNHDGTPITIEDDGPTELVDPERVGRGHSNTGFAADDIVAWAP